MSTLTTLVDAQKTFESWIFRNVGAWRDAQVAGNFPKEAKHVELLPGKLTKDSDTEGGIFHFDKEDKKNMEAMKQPQGRLDKKQLNMIGYLLEIAYDLCLAPASNISGNPGFEVLLGVN